MSDALARGWLLAWVLLGAPPAGALALLLIHRITGGRWGEALGPVLRPLAGLLPLVGLGFLGLLLDLSALYPWAAAERVKPDVAAYYLNPILFALRGVITLAGWSVLTILLLRASCTRLVAGLGLAFYGLTISLVPVDWILSVEPNFTSSAFGASIALHQILAALALTALVRPAALNADSAPDLATLMLTALLGVLYMGLMSYVVAWYGDLPPKAAWYLKRGTETYALLIGAAFLLGGLIPFSFLLFAGVRSNPFALRIVGFLILIGLTLRFAWLLLPAYEEGALATALAAFVMLSLVVSLAVVAARRLRERTRRLRDA